jgi:hypothetical protein
MLTVRSLDPNNPAVVAGTIISGPYDGPTVTFSGPDRAGGVLAGLTILSGTVGVSCHSAVPTIRNCVVECPDGIAVEFWWGCGPNLIGCMILGQVKEGGDPGLIAYWRLDEASGTVATDGAGASNGTLVGNPLWQPEGGQVGGALQLDGADDHVATPFVVNPADGPLSVFAWVKGGAPGQVIVSQIGAANWLMADVEGKLRTELKAQSRQAAPPLLSQAVITDNAWHRISLVWSGSRRSLYVDGQEVACDATDYYGRVSASGGLYFGVGSTLGSGTFWSGLIDDVRIYNRAVRP